MDNKSIAIGMLMGVCLCLSIVLVLGEGVETAVAGPVGSLGRYQIAVAEHQWPHVIDVDTGTVHLIRTRGGRSWWVHLIDGPPRERPKPVGP